MRLDAELIRAPYVGLATTGVVDVGATEVGEQNVGSKLVASWEIGPTQLRAQLYVRLEQTHPRLADKARGVWNALDHGGPDAHAQAADSVQELIDNLLRFEAPDEEALAWCETNYLDGIDDGRITRRGRLQYIFDKKDRDPVPAVKLTDAVLSISKFAQSAKHTIDFGGGEMLSPLMLALEGLLGYLLL